MVTDAVKADRMDEEVLRIVKDVKRIETPRGLRLWKIISTHDGEIVPVFVVDTAFHRPRVGRSKRCSVISVQ